LQFRKIVYGRLHVGERPVPKAKSVVDSVSRSNVQLDISVWPEPAERRPFTRAAATGSLLVRGIREPNEENEI
jgi:hypothetical protein